MRKRSTVAALVALVLLSACAAPGGRGPRPIEPVHVAEARDAGDAQRRASTRLVLEALDAEIRERPEQAIGLLQSALQVDPTNPWAYLVLARSRAEGAQPATAIPALDQAQSRLLAEGELDPRAEVHLVGIRGLALARSGQPERGRALLADAALRAPGVWGDGRLDARELR